MLKLCSLLFCLKNMAEDECIIDCETTHTILSKKIYFSSSLMRKAFIATIAGSSDLIDGSGGTALVLPNGTSLHIKNALYSPRSRRTLLSFKDIRLNGYHLQTIDKKGTEYLYITQVVSYQKRVLENFLCISSGLYFPRIKVMESHTVLIQKIND